MAVPRDVAARISRLSLRKVDYWARTRLVEPTVDTRGSTGRVRLYGFLDLLALVVAAELNARGVPVQHIRQVVGHLTSRGYDRPLSELTFATVGKPCVLPARRRNMGGWPSTRPACPAGSARPAATAPANSGRRPAR
ncbi:MAG: MerR family transcriptional regulator [Pseudonocardiaceae bacterium]